MSRMKGKKTQNTHIGTTKASTRIILVPMYNIFRLLLGDPDHSSSESYREKQKSIGYFTEEGLYIIDQCGRLIHLALEFDIH